MLQRNAIIDVNKLPTDAEKDANKTEARLVTKILKKWDYTIE